MMFGEVAMGDRVRLPDGRVVVRVLTLRRRCRVFDERSRRWKRPYVWTNAWDEAEGVHVKVPALMVVEPV